MPRSLSATLVLEDKESLQALYFNPNFSLGTVFVEEVSWAEVLVVETAPLSKRGQQATLDFIESQYPVVKNTLMELQSQLKEKQDYYDQGLLKLERSWS